MANTNKAKRDKDLYEQLREKGVRKSAADQISKAAAGLDSGRKKAEEVVTKAVEDLRGLAGELDTRVNRARGTAAAKTTAAKKTDRSAAAKRGAATRKRSATKRSATARKAAAARKTTARRRST
ncbi:MAG: hypothetical protein M3Q53_03370, partial [Actinomycetota bacterium]|nr:hypothetical protein [Actinomycetota bacterium]